MNQKLCLNGNQDMFWVNKHISKVSVPAKTEVERSNDLLLVHSNLYPCDICDPAPPNEA